MLDAFGMRLKSLVIGLVAALALAGCMGSKEATTPAGTSGDNGSTIPANMPALKVALGFVPPTPEYAPPLAKAQANATSVRVGVPVRFTAEGTSDPQGLPLSYAWSFGDGAIAEGASTTHAYAAAGEFIARLTVTNAQDLADHAALTLQVAAANRAPTTVPRVTDEAGATLLTANVGQRLLFDSTASSDPEGSPLSIDWDFGDSTTSHEPKTAHSYASPGRFTVLLHAHDADGLTSTASTVVRVNTVYSDSGEMSVAGDRTSAFEFFVAPSMTKLVVTLTFDGGFGANDLTLALQDAGARDAGTSKVPTPAGAQGAQTRTLTLDAAALAPYASGTWRATVTREAVGPTGVAFTVSASESY